MFRTSPHATAYRFLAFAEGAPDTELERLDSLSTAVPVAAGRVLMHEGHFGNEVHLLVQGELIVERDGQPLAVITPGAVVGEQAVILNAPRNATVRAATDAVILAMTRSEFNTVLEACPHIARNILEQTLARAS